MDPVDWLLDFMQHVLSPQGSGGGSGGQSLELGMVL